MTTTTSSIQYCQRCRAPLWLNESLESMTGPELELLVSNARRHMVDTSPKNNYRDISKEGYSGAPTTRRDHGRHEASETHHHGRPYPPERLKDYNMALKSSSLHSIPHGKFDRRLPHRKSDLGPKRTSVGDSYVVLTESQVEGSHDREKQDGAGWFGHGLNAVQEENARKQQPWPEHISRPNSTTERQPSETVKEEEEVGAISGKVELTERLFDILSDDCEIDFPICMECTDLLTKTLEDRHSEVNRERDAYAAYLKQLQSKMTSDEEMDQAEQLLRSLQQSQDEAFEKLKEAEKSRKVVEQELKQLKLEEEALTKEEEEFWTEQNQVELELKHLIIERESASKKYEHKLSEVNELKRVNVYKDVFCIEYDEPIASINCLRLGKIDSGNDPVEWSEINAALGHLLLLLATMAERLEVKIAKYKLRPMGPFSRIEKIKTDANGEQTTESLELFVSERRTLDSLFRYNRLDAPMEALADILAQLGRVIEERESRQGDKMPHKVIKDKVGAYSVKLSAKQGSAGWTAACRNILIDAEWILDYVSNRLA